MPVRPDQGGGMPMRPDQSQGGMPMRPEQGGQWRPEPGPGQHGPNQQGMRPDQGQGGPGQAFRQDGGQGQPGPIRPDQGPGGWRGGRDMPPSGWQPAPGRGGMPPGGPGFPNQHGPGDFTQSQRAPGPTAFNQPMPGRGLDMPTPPLGIPRQGMPAGQFPQAPARPMPPGGGWAEPPRPQPVQQQSFPVQRTDQHAAVDPTHFYGDPAQGEGGFGPRGFGYEDPDVAETRRREDADRAYHEEMRELSRKPPGELTPHEELKLNSYRREQGIEHQGPIRAGHPVNPGTPTPHREQTLHGRLNEHDPRLQLHEGALDQMRTTQSGLSVFNSSEAGHLRTSRLVQPDSQGRFTVDLHGSPDGVNLGRGEVSAHTLAEVIRATPGYRDGQPVRLLACQAGQGFAADLARELGAPVTASRHDVWVDTQGNVFASRTEVSERGERVPGWPPGGEWVTFDRDGSQVEHRNPFPPGHEPNWGEGGMPGNRDDVVAYSRGDDPGTAAPAPTPVPGEHYPLVNGQDYETHYARPQLDNSNGFPNRLDDLITQAADREGLPITRADFDRIRNTPIEDFTPDDARVMHAIRDEIRVQDGEMLQRALTAEAAAALLTNAVIPDASWANPPSFPVGCISAPDYTKGFTARYADVAHLRTPGEVIDGLRLDYDSPDYVDRNGRPPYQFTDNSIVSLRFPFEVGATTYKDDAGNSHTATTPLEAMPIAYGNHEQGKPFPMGGTSSIPEPFTGNGFTGSQHNPVPEFELNRHEFNGPAEMWLTDANGKSVLIGAYDPNTRQWVPTPEGDAYAQAQNTMAAVNKTRMAAAKAELDTLIQNAGLSADATARVIKAYREDNDTVDKREAFVEDLRNNPGKLGTF